MAWAWINPHWRAALHRQGLVAATDFLRLPGMILCGHPDRHVLKVELSISAYLKKEHRVPLRDRLANAWAGFGFVSKSTREAEVLQGAARAGVPCPEVLAHGARGRQAFLLLEEQPGMTELRHYLMRHAEEKHAVARALGHELARLHAAGYAHGDLYSKHVLVGSGRRFCFLDWQRARRWQKVPRAVRRMELATLDATIPGALASDRARLACLHAYLGNTAGPAWKTWATSIRRLSLKLQKKRRISNLRRLPLPDGVQNLIWLDGEALCVTRAFREVLGEQIPDWLRFRSAPETGVERSQVPLPGGGTGSLVRRSAPGFVHRLFSWWQRRPAPEVEQAATIFRLERHEVACPKLLAFGQDWSPRWRRHSFLLTDFTPMHGSLADVLHESSAVRPIWLRRAGELVRRLHESGHILGRHAGDASIFGFSRANHDLAIAWVDGLERRPRNWPDLAIVDLPKLSWLGDLSRTDKMRFIHGYLRITRLNREGRVLVRHILARLPWEAAR